MIDFSATRLDAFEGCCGFAKLGSAFNSGLIEALVCTGSCASGVRMHSMCACSWHTVTWLTQDEKGVLYTGTSTA